MIAFYSIAEAQSLDVLYTPNTPYTSKVGIYTRCIHDPWGGIYNCWVEEGKILDEPITRSLPEGDSRTAISTVSGLTMSGRASGVGPLTADAEHLRWVHVAAKPNTYVKIDIQYSMHITGPTGAASLYFRGLTHKVPDGETLSKVGSLSVIAKTGAEIIEEGTGKKFCTLGRVDLNGTTGDTGNIGEQGGTVAFENKVTNISAWYAGKVVFYNGGGNQTWLVGEKLPVPLSVKVADGESGALPAQQVDITFTMRGPDDTVVWSGSSKTSLADGIAKTDIVLGSLPGTYKITATCHPSVCNSGVTDVIFTEYAKTREEVTELSVVQCEKYAAKNDKIYNAFIVRAFNTLTHKAEQGLTVNFDKDAFPNGAVGQKVLPGSAITNKDGIASASMWTGDVSGGYAYKAECPDCQGNQLEHCVVLADLPPFMEAAPKDEGPVAGDPNETPMLRIVNIGYPDANDRVSFTTLPNENKIDLVAEVSPANLAGDIQWKVEDSEDDHVVSGNPGLTLPLGPESSFLAMAPAAPSGRPGPLEYKVQASVVTPKGLVKSYPRYVKQDVIDKCRQEYVDFGVPWEEVGRNRFSVGGSEYSVDIVDCYAYIYPDERAGQLSGLRSQINEFFVKVTSGYRSPRGNRKAGSKSNLSKHLFGDAVDIAPRPVDVNGSNMKLLWNLSPTPKLLEKGASIILRSWETPTNDTVFKHVDHVHIGN